MKTFRSILYLLCLVSLCSFGACKMTEEQMRSIPPEMFNQNLAAPTLRTEAAATETPKRMPFGLVFAGLALLVGAVIYLKAEDVTPGRTAPRRRTKRAPKSRKKR